MRYVLIVILVTWVLAPARANDTAVVGVGGRVTPMHGEHPSVRMERERVRMDVYADHYDVAAQFLFRNTGPATTVTMGFPERGTGDINPAEMVRRSGFRRFRTAVDGKPVQARRRPATLDTEAPAYRAYWVKPVAFAADQVRTVRVEYRSDLGSVSDGTQFVRYDFTGGAWQGAVEHTDLVVVPHAPGTYLVETFGVEMQQQGARFSCHWQDWQAELNLAFHFRPTLADAWLVARPLWYTREHRQYLVTVAGQCPKPIVAPPALQRGGVTFISLGELAWRLQAEAGDLKARKMASKQWDARRREAVLRAGETILRVRPGDESARVDGQAPISLPAAPFILGQIGNAPGSLYVPLQPLVQRFGGAIRALARERVVVYTLPLLKQSPGDDKKSTS